MEGCESSKISTHSELLFHAADFALTPFFPAQGRDLGGYTNCTNISGVPSNVADRMHCLRCKVRGPVYNFQKVSIFKSACNPSTQ